MAKFYYGGQAVVEGVMMRGRTSVAMAVRRPDDSIYLYEEALSPRLYANRLFRLPFLRGILMLWEMLVLGTRLMTLATNIATGAVEPGSSGEDRPATARQEASLNGTDMGFHSSPGVDAITALDEELQPPSQIGGAAFLLMLLVSLGLAIGIFFLGTTSCYESVP